MSGRNTEGFGEYVGNHLFYGVLLFWGYRRLLFSRLEGFSPAASRNLLIGMAVAGCLLGILLHVRRGRNGASVFANITLPFGIYTMLAYRAYFGVLFAAALIAAGVLSGLFAACVLCRKISRGSRAARVWRNRLRLAFAGAWLLFAAALSGAALYVGAGRLFGSGILEPSVEAASGPGAEVYTIANQMDTLLCLQEDVWDGLSATQRLDVLQTVANIERRYLGIPHALPVSAANLEDGTLGTYDSENQEILLNLENLSRDPALEMLEVVCHEAYHGYQHCLVYALENVPEESRQLRLFRDARAYQEEFGNYQDGSSGFLAYYAQDCELDARDYAEEAVADYSRRLEEYRAQQ